ncbi:coenzyme F420-0:L-glutamate ligase/coenzyme F420-1:gamma-L-glutamate ligase [Diaminobutyricimonas aerilata]|uniref:Coenzyme F420-0:L-glutamate ligase/coenzyme F420-1:gamma-L-glutamate ligase n=1 Tax=Diaminobutyricimonas aerilata TaxID=1162967 RepID=A0A2M9CII0_9MICO|nr:coenzyme F420-0:L-glutamate ligase [Diaminobutyricimonas aerilata]PJJ71697.1 coenzyme F420-0:L-glutamate ligase/coenzyme F420-1:gamma-L-glutamate ligase [Diaminobutyricimonas aerilata]
MTAPRLTAWAVDGIPEVHPGDDLVALVGDALADEGIEHGDIVAVTSKIVSKAEGRVVAATDREDAITAETVRLVASRVHPNGVTRIVENRLGLVMAAAGVDASNVAEGTVLLLPEDPDATARTLASALRTRFGVEVGVVISDTAGRPWRDGQTDIAIGAAGIRVLDDLRGSTDAHGRRLDVTAPAVADEIAAVADLVKGKASGRPVAVVRGLGHLVGPVDLPGARALVRTGENDMFRMGTAEAIALGRRLERESRDADTE